MPTAAEPASSPLLPTSPTAAEWRAMTPTQRERLLVAINEALSDPLVAMTEGRRHQTTKTRTLDTLGLHFAALGRTIYLAEEMSVLYPGEKPFSPDVLAVLDVPQPEDDERMGWVVLDEGRGLDLVIEVLHRGDRDKDLVGNVERYARLGIPEYFVFDRAREKIHGYRLPAGDARKYRRIVPQFGRHHSEVLGLDIAVLDGQFKFFYGAAELIRSADLIGRLEGMVSSLEARADQAQGQADLALGGLRRGIGALIEARGLPCSDEDRARLAGCDDPAILQRWLLQATRAGSTEEIFAPEALGATT